MLIVHGNIIGIGKIGPGLKVFILRNMLCTVCCRDGHGMMMGDGRDKKFALLFFVQSFKN